MIKIIQTYYPNIEIDNKERDIIQIWMNGKQESNVIQIERENIKKVIEVLSASITKNDDPDL